MRQNLSSRNTGSMNVHAQPKHMCVQQRVINTATVNCQCITRGGDTERKLLRDAISMFSHRVLTVDSSLGIAFFLIGKNLISLSCNSPRFTIFACMIKPSVRPNRIHGNVLEIQSKLMEAQ